MTRRRGLAERGPGSLKSRLILGLIAVNTLVLLGVSVVYLWRGYMGSEAEVLDHLDDLARDLALTAVRDGEGHPVLPREGPGQALYDPATGRSAPGSDPSLVRRLAVLGDGDLREGLNHYRHDETGEIYQVAYHRVDRPDGALIGIISHDGEPGVELLDWVGHEMETDLIPLFVPLLLLSALVTVATVSVGLGPVRALSRDALELGPDRLDLRLFRPGIPTEIRPLVRAIDESLDRVQAGFESQRRFTANAAHELRTPLSVLKARCSLVSDRTLKGELERDIDRMAGVVNQLLSVARLEGRGLVLEDKVDLGTLARGVVADLYPHARRMGRILAVEEDQAVVVEPGNTDALRDALRNLLENALRVSPVGEEVVVRVGPDRAMRVLDRGPGVPDAEREDIFLPFNRCAGDRDGRGGAGLGLAITRDIMTRHGGRVSVTDRSGGGAVFTLDFP
ncbi:MAG: HAMP domain-containing histidine kinase [Rhodospirillum sp.]|nr:HAMP domain-containing histidine kinase [Rhodospirillum sp.]MCF8488020.1 HAMP domain-containing histidine kinase [Rhodospirillum sp.]MCF8500287.1 HAMP domain-containing histidine kinase [Rhodospirillum sp.]